MGYPGIHTIRGLMGVCHLLVDRDGAILLDTGLVGESWLIRRRVARLGLTPEAIKAIVLTHGHLDHAGNLAWAKHWCGAPIYAHAYEQAHIDGTYPYAGVNAWCGRLERAGRALFRNGQPARIDVTIQDGDELPFWGGLRVVHLPGHTLGHCGFYAAKHDLLFSGDLFASYFFNVHLPPPILNDAPALIPESLEKARRLNPRLMVPQHYDVLDGALHRRRFDRLMMRQLRSRSVAAE
jgi:glyoxylase-like metal-dependent hydrolase (beta-lactamase superfamily II)